MSRAVHSNRVAADPVEKAMAAWGELLPDWVIILAETCRGSTQSAIAKKLGYSASTVSQVLSRTYLGDMAKFEQMVRGALMSETVGCPELGEITRNICLAWQAKPYAATSSLRARMYRACRGICPHSRISTERGETDAF